MTQVLQHRLVEGCCCSQTHWHPNRFFTEKRGTAPFRMLVLGLLVQEPKTAFDPSHILRPRHGTCFCDISYNQASTCRVNDFPCPIFGHQASICKRIQTTRLNGNFCSNAGSRLRSILQPTTKANSHQLGHIATRILSVQECLRQRSLDLCSCQTLQSCIT